MTPPEDQKPEDLRLGLNEIFGGKPKPDPEAPEPEAPAPETPRTEASAQPSEAELLQEELATLQDESPAVQQVTETATETVSEEIGNEDAGNEQMRVPESAAQTASPAPTELPAAAEAEPVRLESASAPAAEKAPLAEHAAATPAPPAAAAPVPEVAPVPAIVPAPIAAPTVTPAPAAPASSGGVSNDLEEVVYASTAPASSALKEGDAVEGYHLDEDLGRGWFSAHSLADHSKHDVYVRPDPLWAGVAAHRMLPKTTKAGAIQVVEPMAGPPLAPPLSAAQARAYVQDFTRLLFALEKQGYAVTDLDPRTFLQTAQGLKLRFPPRLSKLGAAAEPTLRDGFTPPEVQAGQVADARSGIYLLGAALYGWLTGQTLPPEGASAVTMAGVGAPGMPQLLNMMLGDLAQRTTPAQLLEYLKVQAANDIPKYDIAGGTNIGLNPERPTNEDSYGYFERQVEAHAAPELHIRACVSDGMGGMAAGEVASRAAVQTFLNSSKPTLTEMVWDANAAVIAAMDGKDGGCTITGVEIRGTQLLMGHVGDTRGYHRTGSEVTQLSKDHSYVAAMVASGQMTDEEAQHSPDRNKVLRSLGSLRVPQDNYVQTLEAPLELKVGDRILLVSDGVWGEVEPPELTHLLLTEANLQNLVDTLLERALAAGAPDNITALVIERVR